MPSTRFTSGVLASMLLLTWPAAAGAQPDSVSLAELKPLAEASSTVTVIDSQGQRVRGTIVDAVRSQLSVRVGHEIRRFQAAEVRSVRLRKRDSPANGALIGASIAGGLAALMFLDNECHDDPVCYEAVAVYTGLGALAGLGIDALVRDEVVVYPAGAPRTSQAIRVVPLAGRGRKGVRLTIAF